MTRKPTLSYDFSIAGQQGVVAPNNFMSIFNPPGSPGLLAVGAVFISSGAINAASSVTPMRGWRISTATGGTQALVSEITKFDTAHPDPIAELRFGNPAVTLGSAVFNSPPILTTGTGGTNVHDVQVPPGAGPFLLRPGQGMVMRTESGDVDQSWNLTVVWAEIR